ncbi:microtubule-associated tumor suppressor 1 homolog [Anguilla anguilla]|uniref:microtubule-associated tumor suppressor 1 homolog n=1 Tax=Anguilla anguilla TaxID=7936 RepID=UPI0015B2CE25|nr:microtubule-associated tumor suppressor 1 homolog [Anguilla anguilla]XP_035274902.1 microtubule-associated tumor suppressor 1 homolog [Anguilla anguilla]XP_035274904.1 microtubule-associated tumor suppressor 1 homolog [Anguilla anguilla]
MSELLSQTNTCQPKERNCSECPGQGRSDQDVTAFRRVGSVFPPHSPLNTNGLTGGGSEGTLEMETAGSGTGSEAPSQTRVGQSRSNPEDDLVCLNAHVGGQVGSVGLLVNEGGVSADPRCPVGSEPAGGAGVAGSSTDASGTAGREVLLLSERSASTIRTSIPARDPSHKKAPRVPLPSARRPVHPLQERRCAPVARCPGNGARGVPAANKPAEALPRPDAKRSRSRVQPRPAAPLRMSRAAQPKAAAKESSKSRGLMERGHSEPLKRGSATAGRGTREPAGQRPFGGGGAAAPAPGATRRLALPVARLRLDSSGKDGRSAGQKPVPAAAPAASAAVTKAGDKIAPSMVAGGPLVLGGVSASRAGGVRNRAATLPGKSAIGCRAAAVTVGAVSRQAPSPLQRTRLVRPAAALPVDRTKKRGGPRTQPPPGKPQAGPPPRDGRSPRAPSQDVQQLRSLLAAGGRRFEAVTVVMQQILAERDEARKRCTELSLELVALRDRLVTTATSCDELEKEKDELRMAFEGVLRKAQERHHSDLAELEEQLAAFYSAEWEKVHQAYQQEADKCRSRMVQQVNDVRSKHETLEKELRASHSEKMESLKRHYETSFEELKQSQEQERETHKQSLKEMETTLSEQIQDLARENTTLSEKLKAEEENRRLLAEKSQDSHTLYLQQELESLKVVLELKNTELHQQNKKLMELKTLRETNLDLEGCLRKTQQENEDLKARLDEHTTLHRQLSTEQVALQQTIMKETKMNNRLSLQNEELLWKLHNGDLWPPRNLPPSPSFQSARNSGHFSSTPLSSS